MIWPVLAGTVRLSGSECVRQDITCMIGPVDSKLSLGDGLQGGEIDAAVGVSLN